MVGHRHVRRQKRSVSGEVPFRIRSCVMLGGVRAVVAIIVSWSSCGCFRRWVFDNRGAQVTQTHNTGVCHVVLVLRRRTDKRVEV